MFGCCLRALHASLHGIDSALLIPGRTVFGSISTSFGSSLTVSDPGLQVREPQRAGSPQQGRSVREAKRAASSSASSGGGVLIRRLLQLPGQFSQGVLEQTVEERALQKALPKLFRGKNVSDRGWNQVGKGVVRVVGTSWAI